MKKRRKYIAIGIISILIFVIGMFFYGILLMSDEDRYGDLVYFDNEVKDGDIIFRNTQNGFNDFGLIEKNYFQKVYVWDSKNTVRQNLFTWAEKSKEEKVKVYRIFSKDDFNLNVLKLNESQLNSLKKSGKLKFVIEN